MCAVLFVFTFELGDDGWSFNSHVRWNNIGKLAVASIPHVSLRWDNSQRLSVFSASFGETTPLFFTGTGCCVFSLSFFFYFFLL